MRRLIFCASSIATTFGANYVLDRYVCGRWMALSTRGSGNHLCVYCFADLHSCLASLASIANFTQTAACHNGDSGSGVLPNLCAV